MRDKYTVFWMNGIIRYSLSTKIYSRATDLQLLYRTLSQRWIKREEWREIFNNQCCCTKFWHYKGPAPGCPKVINSSWTSIHPSDILKLLVYFLSPKHNLALFAWTLFLLNTLLIDTDKGCELILNWVLKSGSKQSPPWCFCLTSNVFYHRSQ